MSKLSIKSILNISLLFLFFCSTSFAQNSPVKFSGFDYGAGIALQWQPDEKMQEGDYFTVERMMNDQREFMSIAEVPATKAVSQLQALIFEDKDLGIEKARYRVACYGKGDIFKYETSTIEVKKDVVNNFKIKGVEEMEQNQHMVTIYSIAEGDLSYRLSSFDGETIMKETLRMEKGENQYLIDIREALGQDFMAIFNHQGYSITKNFKKETGKAIEMARHKN